jgi:dCTP diphosphatase
MSEIEKLTRTVVKFRDERNWGQYHNPKDLALSLLLEAAEVLECFQWKNPEEIDIYIREHKEEISEELADTLYWILLMSHDLGIDIVRAFENKLRKNAQKYPVKKARGVHTKYSKL